MDIRMALKQGIATLRQGSVPSGTLAAELLLLHATGRDRTWLYAHPDAELSASEWDLYSALLQRRAEGIPTQHLTGKQEFWGLEFEVNPDVLIPRPETEHLIEVALDRLGLRESRCGRAQKTEGQGFLIVDIGTGSGCIAVALAKELPEAKIYATDISAAALEVARRNAKRHSFANRIHFVESNLFETFSAAPARSSAGARSIVPPRSDSATEETDPLSRAACEILLFDLVVSNPPYIGRHEREELPREVREHEPEVALYGGEQGYEFYADLIPQSASRLKSGGLLVIELGHDSLPAVQPLMESPGWCNVAVTSDLAGIPRVIAAERA
jgi:release factor glutamine methyltransferase